MSSTGEELYKQREQRFNDIVALKKPDHVPVIGHTIHYFADLWKGYSHKEAGFNHPQHYAAIREATIEFGWEFEPTNALFAADGYEALGITQLRWPGGSLPDDVGFQFVEAIREVRPRIVGLSGLLTLAFDSMKATVDGIAAAGLRDQVKIMVGGAPADEQVQSYTGADGWGNDVGQALKLAAEWTGGAA